MDNFFFPLSAQVWIKYLKRERLLRPRETDIIDFSGYCQLYGKCHVLCVVVYAIIQWRASLCATRTCNAFFKSHEHQESSRDCINTLQ